CDNTTNNDVMVDKPESLLPSFGGNKDHTQCFACIINLVTKSFLHLFDPFSRGGDGNGDTDNNDNLPDLQDLLGEMHDERQSLLVRMDHVRERFTKLTSMKTKP
ncbi:hypothetical protein K438DRAFT_1566122, partial [Mycena galopus ATCC 62051]